MNLKTKRYFSDLPTHTWSVPPFRIQKTNTHFIYSQSTRQLRFNIWFNTVFLPTYVSSCFQHLFHHENSQKRNKLTVIFLNILRSTNLQQQKISTCELVCFHLLSIIKNVQFCPQKFLKSHFWNFSSTPSTKNHTVTLYIHSFSACVCLNH